MVHMEYLLKHNTAVVTLTVYTDTYASFDTMLMVWVAVVNCMLIKQQQLL